MSRVLPLQIDKL